MSSERVICPECSHPIEYQKGETVLRCSYCGRHVNLTNPPPAVDESSTGRAVASPLIPQADLEEMRSRWHAGDKLEAIKQYRRLTEASLEEAKTALEVLDRLDAEDMGSHPELKKRIQKAVSKKAPRSKGIDSPNIDGWGTILGLIGMGLFLLGISLIFPMVFLPMAIEAWQAADWGGFIGLMFTVLVWFLVWGALGAAFMYGGFSSFFNRMIRKNWGRR